MFWQFLTVAIFGVAYASVDHLTWNDCGTDPNRPFKIYSISATPMPVVMPGTITFSFNGSLSRAVEGGVLEFDIRRHVPILGNVYIPCLFGVGSCDLPNYCSLLGNLAHQRDQTGRNFSRQITNMLTVNHINLACPIPTQKLIIAPTSFFIPDIGSLTSVIAAGDYTIKVNLKDKHDGEVGCVSLKVGLKAKSGGFLFG